MPTSRPISVLTFGSCLLLAACMHQPKEVDDRPVIGVKRVNGKLVYVLGEKPGDKEEVARLAREAEAAAAGIVFSGNK